MTPARLSSSSPIRIPLAADAVRAGFPSPAADYMQEQIDLNALLTEDPNTTFLMQAGNNAMANIVEDDYLVIDKAKAATHGSMVVVEYDGGFLLRRLHMQMGVYLLQADNSGYPVIEVPADGIYIWGVVVGVVRKV